MGPEDEWEDWHLPYDDIEDNPDTEGGMYINWGEEFDE